MLAACFCNGGSSRVLGDLSNGGGGFAGTRAHQYTRCCPVLDTPAGLHHARPSPCPQAPWIEATVGFHAAGKGETLMGQPMSAAELAAWDGRTAFSPAPPRRVFKTHAAVGLAPWRGGLRGLGGARVVVVTRNPKDACVSMFNHARDAAPFAYTGDFAHFVTRLFLPGKVESGCFWEWHAGRGRAARGARNPGSANPSFPQTWGARDRRRYVAAGLS